jgi:hypothetical protein
VPVEEPSTASEADIRDSVGCATRRAHFLVDLILEGLTLLRDEAPVALKVNPSRNTFWRLPSRLNHTLCAPNQMSGFNSSSLFSKAREQ